MRGYDIFSVISDHFSRSWVFGPTQFIFLLFFILLLVAIYLISRIPENIRKNADDEFAEFVINRSGITPTEKAQLIKMAEVADIKPLYRLLISRKAFKKAEGKYLGNLEKPGDHRPLDVVAREVELIGQKLHS